MKQGAPLKGGVRGQLCVDVRANAGQPADGSSQGGKNSEDTLDFVGESPRRH